MDSSLNIATSFRVLKNSRNFVIIAQSRTGSTLVATLLHSHPEIRALVEPINPSGHDHVMQPKESENLLPDDMVHDNLEEALSILFKPVMPRLLRPSKYASTTGFKIMIHQIQALRSEEYFWQRALNTVKIIVVLRHNILRQVVSEAITCVTERSNYWGDDDPPSVKVTLDLDFLENRIVALEAERRYLEKRLYGREFLQLWYEDIKDNLLEVNNAVAYLDCGQTQLTTRLRQQNNDSLENLIVNFEQVKHVMKRMNREQFLES